MTPSNVGGSVAPLPDTAPVRPPRPTAAREIHLANLADWCPYGHARALCGPWYRGRCLRCDRQAVR